ncbi:MAG TPA: branched-chain amino acid aminotransferase [Pyrinomonadaceae bacterium]|jgi:branched-chain amino acid aminotransferase
MTTSAASFAIERSEQSRIGTVDFSNLPFGTLFSDHMLIAEFRNGAWSEPVIKPYGPLLIPPNISALQYGISVFEGLKAHRSPSGEILIFRPHDNARRLNRSAARLAMPNLPEEFFVDGLRELLRLDQRWVPSSDQGSLYIRPTFFSIDESIRVKPAEQYMFVIFTCPVGSYFNAPLAVLITDEFVRAFPGGTGDVKPAGNYAPALLAEQNARAAGFHHVVWLDGIERRFIEECGVMNIFFVIDNRIITPSLSGTILGGMLRDSVLTLLRDLNLEIEERRISVEEVFAAHASGRLTECFGTGTAATVSHVKRIHYREQDLILPDVERRTVGPAVRQRLIDIMTGRAEDPYGWTDRV